jgi:hypothetical protein
MVAFITTNPISQFDLPDLLLFLCHKANCIIAICDMRYSGLYSIRILFDDLFNFMNKFSCSFAVRLTSKFSLA